VGETHGTIREQAMKPRSGDMQLVARSMSPLCGFGRYWRTIRGLTPPG
jgi:hypothetical protein